MKLTLQKRLAGNVSGASPKRIVFDASKLEEVKEAITKHDVRKLIKDGVIYVSPARGVSRSRANHIKRQKKKGLMRGAGSKKGKFTARNPGKDLWMNKIRSQRKFLKRIVDGKIVSHAVYKDLYRKSSGGYFRSVKHIQIFMTEKGLVEKDKLPQAGTE